MNVSGKGTDGKRGTGVGEGNWLVGRRLLCSLGLRSAALATVFLSRCYGVWAERRLGARPLRLCVVSLQGWQSRRVETTVWEPLALELCLLLIAEDEDVAAGPGRSTLRRCLWEERRRLPWTINLPSSSWDKIVRWAHVKI